MQRLVKIGGGSDKDGNEWGTPVGKNANKLALREIWLHMSFREVGTSPLGPRSRAVLRHER